MWLKKSFSISKQKHHAMNDQDTTFHLYNLDTKLAHYDWIHAVLIKDILNALITWMSKKWWCLFKSQAVPVVSLAARFPEWPNILYWTITSGVENEGSYRCRLCTEAPDSEVAADTVPLTATHTHTADAQTLYTHANVLRLLNAFWHWMEGLKGKHLCD